VIPTGIFSVTRQDLGGNLRTASTTTKRFRPF
jgi:hypothetical protein